VKITVEVPNFSGGIGEVIVKPNGGVCNFIGTIVSVEKSPTEREKLLKDLDALYNNTYNGDQYQDGKKLLKRIIEKVFPE
jgi:hypothetical protein